VLITTPRGDAQVSLNLPHSPVSLLVLGHGAGGGIDAPDLSALAVAACTACVAVARVEQPYRVAGRRAPAPAPHLDEAWVAVVAALRAEPGFDELPVVVAGRSSGGRVACRTAGAVGAAAVVALAFPVHPPRRPERSRLAELDMPAVPVLVVQGDRDPFGMPEPVPGRRDVHVVPGADHSLRSAPAAVAGAVVDWLAARGLARPGTLGV
jgi:uncharacterized protein